MESFVFRADVQHLPTMLMNMPGGTRPLHSISPWPALQSACIPLVMWVMVRLYTRPLDTSARPQPGVSVARVWTLTGGRGPETRCCVSNVWPGPGQCGLCCGAVVVMLSGQPGRPGRDQSSSLSSLRPTSDRRVCGQWPPAPPKMCQCAQWENRRMRGSNVYTMHRKTHRAIVTTEGLNQSVKYSQNTRCHFLSSKGAVHPIGNV